MTSDRQTYAIREQAKVSVEVKRADGGTLPTGTPLFAGLLVGVVLIVVGLTYFPVVALGPIVEQLGL